MNGTRRRRLGIAVAVALVLVVAGLAVWRWYPRPGIEASTAMREAMQNAVLDVEVSAEPPNPAAHPSTQREHLLAAGWKLIGVPYAYGAKGPDELDCSGFTKSAYKAIGISLPNGSFNQASRLLNSAPYRSTRSRRMAKKPALRGDQARFGRGAPLCGVICPSFSSFRLTEELAPPGVFAV